MTISVYKGSTRNLSAFTVSELFRENQQGGKIPLPSYDPDFEFRTHFLFIRTAAADKKQL